MGDIAIRGIVWPPVSIVMFIRMTTVRRSRVPCLVVNRSFRRGSAPGYSNVNAGDWVAAGDPSDASLDDDAPPLATAASFDAGIADSEGFEGAAGSRPQEMISITQHAKHNAVFMTRFMRASYARVHRAEQEKIGATGLSVFVTVQVS
jgi:hypothetical protein